MNFKENDNWLISRMKSLWPAFLLILTFSGWLFNLYNNLENRVNAVEGQGETLTNQGQVIRGLDEKLVEVDKQENLDKQAIININLQLTKMESKLDQIINLLIGNNP